MILAIDFDGVLHDIANPLPGRKMGAPMPGAIDAMDELRDQGHELIIFSVNNKKVIADWCEHYNVEYDSITNVKPNADLFIDDRALHFDSWAQVMSLFPDEDDE
jgi:predicted HAD superfamily phosphohydrolase YqeG